jgi:hypothetical protein
MMRLDLLPLFFRFNVVLIYPQTSGFGGQWWYDQFEMQHLLISMFQIEICQTNKCFHLPAVVPKIQ